MRPGELSTWGRARPGRQMTKVGEADVSRGSCGEVSISGMKQRGNQDLKASELTGAQRKESLMWPQSPGPKRPGLESC